MVARFLPWAAVALLATVCPGCGGSTSASSRDAARDASAKASTDSSAAVSPATAVEAPKQKIALLNVSYDPTRELYQEVNQAFASHWRQEHNQEVTFEQSHAASGKQARAVIDGLAADVVTLALPYDIDQIAESPGRLLPADWRTKFPHNSSPYTSTITFIVREGNPKSIKDWDDLTKDGVEIIMPNPKISGSARYAYLAAWGYALRKHDGDESRARDFVRAMFANAPALASGTRAATMSFAEQGLGDVLVGWENEAILAVEQAQENPAAAGEFEIVAPSVSVLAEPPVTVVEKNAAAHGTTEVAQAYLKFLYSPLGQRIAAKNHYRPSEPSVVDKELLAQFPDVELFTVDDVFGGWAKAQATHFADGGTFDSIYEQDQDHTQN